MKNINNDLKKIQQTNINFSQIQQENIQEIEKNEKIENNTDENCIESEYAEEFDLVGSLNLIANVNRPSGAKNTVNNTGKNCNYTVSTTLSTSTGSTSTIKSTSSTISIQTTLSTSSTKSTGSTGSTSTIKSTSSTISTQTTLSTSSTKSTRSTGSTSTTLMPTSTGTLNQSVLDDISKFINPVKKGLLNGTVKLPHTSGNISLTSVTVTQENSGSYKVDVSGTYDGATLIASLDLMPSGSFLGQLTGATGSGTVSCGDKKCEVDVKITIGSTKITIIKDAHIN